jgi:hypothetical protein
MAVWSGNALAEGMSAAASDAAVASAA